MVERIKSKFLQLFDRDQGRCVYCGVDLKADHDRFMMATETPLSPAPKAGAAESFGIWFSVCRVCNGLKANFVPDPPLDPIKNRRSYIAAVRAFIMQRRSDRLKEFMQVTHPGLTDYQ